MLTAFTANGWFVSCCFNGILDFHLIAVLQRLESTLVKRGGLFAVGHCIALTHS